MICSAPSRLAAITPQSPTAPSPTTATVVPGADPRGERSVVARPHHVGERQQRRHQRVVLADRQHDERAVGERDAHRLALAAVDAVAAPEAAVEARGLQSLLAEVAGAVGVGERRDDDVARLHGADVGADLLDDADELVAHRAGRPSSCSIWLYGHRSLPQMQARVTRTSASVGSTIRGRERSRPGRRRRRT